MTKKKIELFEVQSSSFNYYEVADTTEMNLLLAQLHLPEGVKDRFDSYFSDSKFDEYTESLKKLNELIENETFYPLPFSDPQDIQEHYRIIDIL
jgi:hypothetical protein